MRVALVAYGRGLVTAARRPGLVLAIWLFLLAVTIPVAATMARALESPLAGAEVEDPRLVPAAWLAATRGERTGIAGTFEAAALGIAAPLANLSAILDADPIPAALLLPAATWLAGWSVVVGAVIARLHPERSGGGGSRFRLTRLAPGLVALAAAAVVTVAVIALPVHRLLFGVLFEAVVVRVPGEPAAAMLRLALTLVFAALLIAMSLMLDYARIALVTRAAGVRAAVGDAWSLLRRRPGAVAVLALLDAAVWAALVIGYYGAMLTVGDGLGGWALAAGHLFVVARIAALVWSLAAQRQLFEGAALG